MSNQPIENGAEKRSYSRVPAHFQALFRRLGSPEEPQLCPRQKRAEDGAAILQAGGAKLPDSLVRYLVNMDAKLDSILSLLQKENLDILFPNRLTVMEVSASGVLVMCGDLELDEYIELVLYLGEFPPRMASAIGRVVRPGHLKFRENSQAFAIQFIKIRDSDREEIVRFVFKEERERIRSEKLR